MQSTKSNETLAVATGTLVLQVGPIDPREDSPQWNDDVLADDIDGRTDLRRLEWPTCKRVPDQKRRWEWRCAVEYGPAFGAHESDLCRQLKTIAGDSDYAVVNVTRREISVADLDDMTAKAEADIARAEADIREMTARAAHLEVLIEARTKLDLRLGRQLRDTIWRLRLHMGCVQECKTAAGVSTWVEV